MTRTKIWMDFEEKWDVDIYKCIHNYSLDSTHPFLIGFAAGLASFSAFETHFFSGGVVLSWELLNSSKSWRSVSKSTTSTFDSLPTEFHKHSRSDSLTTSMVLPQFKAMIWSQSRNYHEKIIDMSDKSQIEEIDTAETRRLNKRLLRFHYCWEQLSMGAENKDVRSIKKRIRDLRNK